MVHFFGPIFTTSPTTEPCHACARGAFELAPTISHVGKL